MIKLGILLPHNVLTKFDEVFSDVTLIKEAYDELTPDKWDNAKKFEVLKSMSRTIRGTEIDLNNVFEKALNNKFLPEEVAIELESMDERELNKYRYYLRTRFIGMEKETLYLEDFEKIVENHTSNYMFDMFLKEFDKNRIELIVQAAKDNAKQIINKARILNATYVRTATRTDLTPEKRKLNESRLKKNERFVMITKQLENKLHVFNLITRPKVTKKYKSKI